MKRVRRLTTAGLVTLGALAGGLVLASAPALAAAPETPETVEAKPIGATTATLHGVLNPGNAGEAGSYDFSYEPSSSLAPECGMPGTLAPSSPVADAGAEGEAKTVALTGLEPNKEYGFCIVAYGLSGGLAEPSYGVAKPFKTAPLPPEVVSGSEHAPTPKATEATLEAKINPNNQETTYSFEYATSKAAIGTAGATKVPSTPSALPAVFNAEGEPVSAPTEPLTPNTTYYYRVVAENATGEKAKPGEIEHFTTALHPTTPITKAATLVTGTTATLNGTLNQPALTKLKYEFEYNTGASCEGGTTTPEGEGEGKVSVPVTGLEGSSEYAFCVVAINEAGEAATGTPLTFKTLATAPVIESETGSVQSPFAATLEATVNPELQASTCEFEYGTDSSLATHMIVPCLTALEGGGGVGRSVALTGLKPGTKYYYRLAATNGTGETKGTEVEPIKEFTTATAEAPSIAGEGISGLSAAGVTFGAHINPNYQATVYGFEYSTTEAELLEGHGTKVAGANPLAAESAELPASVVVSGLEPGKTYFYRATATNNTGTTIDSTVESFTTPVVPLVSTGEAQGITQATATLSGTVDPEGEETSYYFQYVSDARYQTAIAEAAANPYAAGETTAPVKLTEAGGGPYTGDEPQMIPPTLATGLLPGVTYHYRVVAYNELEGKIEASYGQDATFTTQSSTPPIVSTGGVSAVSQNSATLTGTVSTNGLQTNYGFEIETEPGEHYGPATGLGSIGGALTKTVSVTLSKLQPGRTYYYRITATNADGTKEGEPETFTTPGFPTLIAPPESPPLVAYTSPGFPKEEPAVTTPKKLTNAEKLAKALKVCRREKKKSARQKCEKTARKDFGPKQKGSPKKK
jgi:phosphodiesterase/alkaline phosphatase D-like protein